MQHCISADMAVAREKAINELTHNLTQNRKKTVEATEQRGQESIWLWVQ